MLQLEKTLTEIVLIAGVSIIWCFSVIQGKGSCESPKRDKWRYASVPANNVSKLQNSHNKIKTNQLSANVRYKISNNYKSSCNIHILYFQILNTFFLFNKLHKVHITKGYNVTGRCNSFSSRRTFSGR